jgi:hypothetical protein
MAVPDYDRIQDPDQRLHTTVANVEHFLQMMAQHKHAIQRDVEHNRTRLEAAFAEAQKGIETLRNRLDSSRSIFDIMPLDLEHQQWLEFYQNIRDPEWPNCWVPEAFDHLPLSVQQECRDVFGYPDSCYRPSDVVQ